MWRRAFQSTLPAGGATTPKIMRGGIRLYFNPRSPRGERLKSLKCTTGNTNDFNPRSPRGERLYMLTEGHSAPKDFNPRSPRGERPPCLHLIYHERRISIHAPRGGSDPPGNIYMCKIMISIHAPRGGSDLFVADDTGHREIFQSTLPAGGATDHP